MKAIKLLTICCLIGLSACSPRNHTHEGYTGSCACGSKTSKECACDSCKESGKRSCECGASSKAAAMAGHNCGAH